MIGYFRGKPLASLLVVVLVFEALAAGAITSDAILVDEYAHLPAGVAYWRDGLFAMYDENPPLVRYLVALPAVLSGAEMDYSRAGQARRWEWSVSADFRRANPGSYLRMFAWGRAIVTALSVACGALIFRWSDRSYGTAAALVGSALWFLDPNVLAHSTAATVDVGTATFGLLATYLFDRFLRRPSDTGAILAGLGLGLALGAKFSMLVLIPAWSVMALASGFPREGPATAGTIGRALARLGAIAAVALLVLDALYRFRGTPSVLGSLPFLSPTLSGYRPRGAEEIFTGNRFDGSWLGGLVLPLPRDYLVGLDSLLYEQQVIDVANLSGGRLVAGGFWYGPLKTLLFKLPPGTLLLIVAVALHWAGNLRRIRPIESVIWVPPLALIVALCLQGSGMNVAVRYALPALPFLFVAVGRFVQAVWGHRLGRAFVVGCVLWNCASLARVCPSYLSYGNELIGGPSGAQRVFLGSNFDWGQDLFRLKTWADRHPGAGPLVVSYYGAIAPGEIGLKTRRPPSCLFRDATPGDEGPRGGFYWAISSNLLHGLPGLIIGDHGLPELVAGEDGLAPLGIVHSPHLRPERSVARVGHSLYIFRVEPSDRADSSTVGRLTLDQLNGCIKGAGRNDLTSTP